MRLQVFVNVIQSSAAGKQNINIPLSAPITYIRNVLGFTTWNSVLTTSAHPEYSSAHAVISASLSDAFTQIFGNIGSFMDHT